LVLPVLRAPLLSAKCTGFILLSTLVSVLLNWVYCSRVPVLILAAALLIHSVITAFPCYGMAQFWQFSYCMCGDCATSEDWFLDSTTTAKLVCTHTEQQCLSGRLEDATCLIIGCGTSQMPHELASQAIFGKVVATDVMIMDGLSTWKRRLRRWLRYPCGGVCFGGEHKLQWKNADAKSLPFDDDSIDVVCEKGTFAAIAGAGIAATLQCFDEAARVLRPGGLLISVWMSHSKVLSYLARSKSSKLLEVLSVEQISLRIERSPTTLVLVARKRGVPYTGMITLDDRAHGDQILDLESATMPLLHSN